MFPQALANMMNMLRIGGRILHILPGNDWFGHGFYQFGPELFFRVYQPENGFEIVAIELTNVGSTEPWMTMTDRGQQGMRSELGSTGMPIEIMVTARKVGHVKLFSCWPQQGDYQAAWG